MNVMVLLSCSSFSSTWELMTWLSRFRPTGLSEKAQTRTQSPNIWVGHVRRGSCAQGAADQHRFLSLGPNSPCAGRLCPASCSVRCSRAPAPPQCRALPASAAAPLSSQHSSCCEAKIKCTTVSWVGPQNEFISAHPTGRDKSKVCVCSAGYSTVTQLSLNWGECQHYQISGSRSQRRRRTKPLTSCRP